MKRFLCLLLAIVGYTFAQGYDTSVEDFFHAVSAGNTGVVVEALKQDWPLIEEVDEYGQTALIYAIENAPSLVVTLLERGADPNIATNTEWTPLLYAIRKGNATTVELLLANGAYPEVLIGGVNQVDILLKEYPSPEIESLIQAAKAREPVSMGGMLSWAYESEIANRECYAVQKLAEWLSKVTNTPPIISYRFSSGAFGEETTPEEALYNLNKINAWSGMDFLGNLDGGETIQGVWQDGDTVYVNTVRRDPHIFCIDIYPYGF